MSSVTRREFLVGGSVLLAGLISGCAAVGAGKEPYFFPKLPGRKIQPAEYYGTPGCMTGVDLGPSYPLSAALGKYASLVGKWPSFCHLPFYGETMVLSGVTTRAINRMKECADSGVIPFVTYDARDGSYTESDLPGILDGRYDTVIRKAAESLAAFGEKHGGFFIRTMNDMNLYYAAAHSPGWTGNPTRYRAAWVHIWKIFESEGANDYATWVFNPRADPELGIANDYYPGDAFVDWMGFSGWNFDDRDIITYKKTFGGMFQNSYQRSVWKHKTKPVLIVETAMGDLPYKARWIRSAFKEMLSDLAGLRGFAWDHTQWKSSGTIIFDARVDSTRGSLEAFREKIANGHFLGSIPYQDV